MAAICTQSISPSHIKATTLVTHLILGIFCSVYFFELCESTRHIHSDTTSDLIAIVISTFIHGMRLRSTGRLVKTLTHGSLFYVFVLLGALQLMKSIFVWNIKFVLAVSTINITLFLLPVRPFDSYTDQFKMLTIIQSHGSSATEKLRCSTCEHAKDLHLSRSS